MVKNRGWGEQLRESRLVSRFVDPRPVVAVVRLGGVIGRTGGLRQGLTLESVAPLLKRAFALSRLEAVALQINSPGGSPVQSALIHRRIRDLAEEREVPVFAFCEDVAASGGYWLACAADEIFADANSIIGSIGVIAAGFGFTGLIEKLGVERRVHTAGTRKGMLDPFQPEKAEDVERLLAIQQEMHESFKALVRERRGTRISGHDTDLFDGSFWTGARAWELGLADGIGEVRGTMRERFGERVDLRQIDAGRRWPWQVLSSSSRAEAGAALVEQAIDTLAARQLWSRYGL